VVLRLALDRDPDLKTKVVVIDDPVSSLDDHRAFATAQHIRALVKITDQVIVFSHNKAFLGRIWQHSDKQQYTALKLSQNQTGSELKAWDIENDAFSDHDNAYRTLKGFLGSPSTFDELEIGKTIRRFLEGYLRVACGPSNVPPGFILGQKFIKDCRDKLLSGSPIISNDGDINELADIVEFAATFHHDGGSAILPVTINQVQLKTFVKRALDYADRI
jgi:wobble nucleotide-excising tRNase